jgi:hypothetical protein
MITAALIAALVATANAEPSIYPTGVTRYNPAKAYNVFILFSGTDEKTHLVDMNGNEVRRWDYKGIPSGMLDPALTGERGHVMVQLAKSDIEKGDPSSKTIGVVDWNGKIVWQWGEHAPGGEALQHHDWSRLPNGNTLVLSILNHAIPGFTLPQLLDDVIYEVTPSGDIVWQWIAADHLDEFGFGAEALALVRQSKNPDYLHLNSMKPLGPNHWFREGDRRFNPDNIIFSSRKANFTAIIAKQTGQIVWRLGPIYAASPAGPRPLPAAIDQISGQHDPQIIPEGLPGAGNLLVFDNQGEAGYPAAALKVFEGSRVLEIDPVKQEIVWQYTGSDSDQPPWSFHSTFISNARRLPNGNTFVDEGMNGRFFQISPAGEIVWEYISPYFGRSEFGPAGSKMVSTNYVYRAQPVPYDWVPADAPHSERAVIPPDPATFRVPAQR